ncbi:serine/threonine-protein kinase [Xylanimonas ulmi]|uniref:non-specific serine/threonine protein kinase n=1 Tax=Xylanimonas ulmi TaxID=228973 RepID=A0A4Q7M8V3_9MICO|nr:serine/threonine protein kinase [Xylanibacterium ulmi]
MSKRPPSPPPRIDGFEYVEHIGSGGFSDVFLYEQRRPRRRVAVKVLLAERSSAQRAAFDAEADLMAALSTHPSIVTMYEAGIAAGGRPYLAMEYCPRPNLGARYRAERLSVAEALRISVQIAGAVETAHRAGILHRDIKPANILVTEYGHPALTDFGISSGLDDGRTPEGMSIPWSPCESFGDPPVSGVASDVWALAATTYTLLAGRSPFEVPGGPNGSADLIARIEHAPLAPTGRDDVPPSLERVLATAMAKRPQSRYASVLAFARALQHVQNELRLAVTPIDLLDELVAAAPQEADDDEGTRLRSVASIDPSAPPSPQALAPSVAGLEATVHRAPARPAPPALGAVVAPGPDERTTLRGDVAAPSAPARNAGPAHPAHPAHPDAPDAPAGPRGRAGRSDARTGLGVVVGALVLTLAVAGGLWAALRDPGDGAADGARADGSGQTAGGAPTVTLPQDNLGALVPPVRDLVGAVQGAEAVFTWAPPRDPVEGDRYAWALLTLTGEPEFRLIDDPTVTVPLAESGPTCVRVVVERDGRFSATPQEACTP